MRKGTAAARPRHGLLTRIVNGVAWLTLDRPSASNRITPHLAQALCDAVASIELDDSVTMVVLAGNGPHFCLGVDGTAARTPDWQRQLDWVNAMARLTRPVVAALHGDACAEGLELAMACDLRLASSRARFALPQVTAGRLPAHGGTQRLPRLVGRTRALDLLLTGRSVGATEAEAMGLVSRVVPASRFSRVLDAMVAELQSKGPIALRYVKEAVLQGSDLTLDQGTRLEEDLYVLLQTTRDRREGIGAFLQKRRPVFRGK